MDCFLYTLERQRMFFLIEPELRKPASTASALAERPAISQEHIGPRNIITPLDDLNREKYIPNHVITLYCMTYIVFRMYFTHIWVFWKSIYEFPTIKFPRNDNKWKYACGTPRHFSQLWIEHYVPNFSRLNTTQKLNIILNGVDQENLKYTSTNTTITYSVQEYILATKRLKVLKKDY